eukprot:m.173079 g.173079  ORF g.173079 m.173079 type:complete len:971 (+) comp16524_c0_seq1:123-3035(+)
MKTMRLLVASLLAICAATSCLVVAQDSWPRAGSAFYHTLVFTAPQPTLKQACATGTDSFPITNHAFSRINFYRQWADSEAMPYDTQLAADAKTAADNASPTGTGVETTVNGNLVTITVYGHLGAYAVDHLMNAPDNDKIVRVYLLRSDLTAAGIGMSCACGQDVTVVLLQLPSSAPALTATSWIAWPPKGWLPYTILPSSNQFSFYWAGVSMNQAVVSVTDAYGLPLTVQILQRTPSLVFSVNYYHRRILEDLELNIVVDTKVVSATHPAIVSYTTTLFDPDLKEACCYESLALSLKQGAAQFTGSYMYSHDEEHYPVYLRNDKKFVLYYATNYWRIAATTGAQASRIDVAAAFAPGASCPNEISAKFEPVNCPLSTFDVTFTCEQPIATTPWYSTTGVATTTTPKSTTTLPGATTSFMPTSSASTPVPPETTINPTSLFTSDDDYQPQQPKTLPGPLPPSLPVWPFAFPAPYYTIQFVGVNLGSSLPKQFSTAFAASALLSALSVQSTDACTMACDNNAACDGVFLYVQGTGLVCRLLSDVGAPAGEATNIQGISLERMANYPRGDVAAAPALLAATEAIMDALKPVPVTVVAHGAAFTTTQTTTTQTTSSTSTTATSPTTTTSPSTTTTTSPVMSQFAFTSKTYRILHRGSQADGIRFSTAFDESAWLQTAFVASADSCVAYCDAMDDCLGFFLFVADNSLLRCHTLGNLGTDVGVPTNLVAVSVVRDEMQRSAVQEAVIARFGAYHTGTWALEAVGDLKDFAQGQRFDSVLAGDSSANGAVSHILDNTVLSACLSWCYANSDLCARVFVYPAPASQQRQRPLSSSPTKPLVSCKTLSPPLHALAPPALVPTVIPSASFRLPRPGEVILDVFGAVRPEFEVRLLGGQVAPSLSRRFTTAVAPEAILAQHMQVSGVDCMSYCVDNPECVGVFMWIDTPASPLQCNLLSSLGPAQGTKTALTSVSLAKRA